MKYRLQVQHSVRWLGIAFLAMLLRHDPAAAFQRQSGTATAFQAQLLPATPPRQYAIGTKRNGVMWSGMRFSADDGKTWSLVMPESNQPFGQPFHYFDSLVFQAQRELGLLSFPRGTWKTTDSGKSWTRLLAEGFSGIAFSDERNGWLSLNTDSESRAENYVTEDGGNAWRLCGTGLAPHHVQLLTKSLGWGIATAYLGPHPNYNRDGVVKTTDGGCSWTWASRNATNGEYDNIQFIDEKQGWIGGEGWGTRDSIYLYHTIDGGLTWSPVKTPPEGVFSLYFSDAEFGWLDTGTEIYSTTDGGKTWKAVRITGLPILLPEAWGEGQFRLAVLEAQYLEAGQSGRKSQKELEQSAIRKVLPNTEGFQWPAALLRTEVEVEITIDADGNVSSAKAVDLNIPDLMLRSLAAAKQWTFPATRLDGSSSPAVGILSFYIQR